MQMTRTKERKAENENSDTRASAGCGEQSPARAGGGQVGPPWAPWTVQTTASLSTPFTAL